MMDSNKKIPRRDIAEKGPTNSMMYLKRSAGRPEPEGPTPTATHASAVRQGLGQSRTEQGREHGVLDQDEMRETERVRGDGGFETDKELFESDTEVDEDIDLRDVSSDDDPDDQDDHNRSHDTMLHLIHPHMGPLPSMSYSNDSTEESVHGADAMDMDILCR
ncbi:hypothetical protein L6452_02102 [Arctium lappa]|uniref:Uncharacterized protein n=1 Tax=Arctium lappa TaxID=4217 RepID=A0ACB9FI71_ARCLA|nr:hypothetical protein L6452_02102 [Arctium lappa]